MGVFSKKMKTYLINILLAITIVYFISPYMPDWSYGIIGIFILLFLVYVVLWLLSWFYDKRHFKKVPKVAALFLYFLKELFFASLKVAYDIVTPKFLLRPGIIAYPLLAKTDLEITLLANMVSLTPGTLSMAVSEDRKTLYVHSLYILNDDKEEVIATIKKGFERRILEITR